MLTAIAHIKAKDNKIEELKEVLLNLIPTTRAEEGCINYDLHQSTEDPALFIFHENWASKNALDEHLQKPHLQAFIEKADELLAEPIQLVTCTMISKA